MEDDTSSGNEDDEEILREKIRKLELKLTRKKKPSQNLQNAGESDRCLHSSTTNELMKLPTDAKLHGTDVPSVDSHPCVLIPFLPAGPDAQFLPQEWKDTAFGSCRTALEWETRLRLIDDMLREMAKPPLQFLPPTLSEEEWLKPSQVDNEVSLRGKLYRMVNTDPGKGKGKRKPKSTLKFEIVPVDVESGATAPVARITIVESGVGKHIFKQLASFLREKEEEGQLIVLKGVVQKPQNAKIGLCISRLDHVTLVGVTPPVYPTVHGMDGTPIAFPLPLNKNNIRRLLGSFQDAWLCPLAGSKLSCDEVNKLRNHISAFRSSGGGVIYLGLRRQLCKITGEYEADIAAIRLSRQELEDMKKQIEEACKAQRPYFNAHEWNVRDSRLLPDNIKQRFDHCFNSYFTADNQSFSSNGHFVVRMVVCPSEEYRIHLSSEKDIGLHNRHGETSSFYPIDRFISKLSETSTQVEEEIKKLSGFSENSRTSCLAIQEGSTLPLWQLVPPEGSSLDNKECPTDDPVDDIMKDLEDYGAVWLNDTVVTTGTLRVGVSNMPPLVTGVWFDQDASLLLRTKLAHRFKGSLDHENFCFPSAKDRFQIIKHQIVTNSNLLLSHSAKALILWLKVPRNSSYRNGFEPFDFVRRRFYSSWAQKTCPILTSLFATTNEHHPLVLPLKLDIKGLVPEAESFPVAITKLRSLDKVELEEMVKKLLSALEKMEAPGLKSVTGYQLLDLSDVSEFLDPNYCVLDVVVHPAADNLLYLCKLPITWKLDVSEDQEHIGKAPKQMDFQEIVLRCKSSSLAMLHLSNFFQFNDRPILITDMGCNDPTLLGGLARIPWTLVLDFDFIVKSTAYHSPNLRQFAESATYVYKIVDLPLYKGFTVNDEDMTDASNVYWIKALGPSDDSITDVSSWRLHLSPQLIKYIKQACTLITTNVKILVVWSTELTSSGFGQAVADLCLAAQQAQPLFVTDTVVVSPAITSPFLTKFKSNELPRPAKMLSMELGELSVFLSEGGPVSATLDSISSRWSRVPHYTTQLTTETVKSMQAGELDYLYPGFEDHLDMSNYDNGLAFFEGSTKFVRWEDFKAKNVIRRHETQSLYEVVYSRLRSQRETIVITFLHNPGAGGSTVARDVVWRLRKTFCCVVPSRIYSNMRHDIKQLICTSEGRAVLVLWDTNLGIDFDALKATLNGLHAVILRVERSSFKQNNTGLPVLEEGLSLEILEQFVIKLSQNLSNSKDALNLLMLSARRLNEKVPLFLVMVTALEGKYLRLPDYVKERLADVTVEQRVLLSRVAFARMYTSQALQVRAVSATDSSWENSLPTSVLGLITFGWQGSRRVRMRHHCIDELVLSNLSECDNKTHDWGLWLANFVVDFIDHLRVMYPDIPEGDSSGNNEFERILRRLFHEKSDEKSDHTPISTFLSLMGSLAGKDAIVQCMRKVLEKLPRMNRIRAHFLGDLARVHLHIKEMDLAAALQVIKEAHALFPSNRTLYHQEGQLFFDAMKRTLSLTLLTFKEPKELAMEIIHLAKQASDCFATSRNCMMQGRTSELYPWITDVRCHIECLKDVCSLMACSYRSLPQSLTSHEYIVNAEKNIMFLLETLSTEDPTVYRHSRLQALELLGREEDIKEQLLKLFHEIDGGKSLEVPPKDSIFAHKNLYQLAKTLQQTSYLLRLTYGNARKVPENLSTRLTLAIIWLIEQPRVINSVLAHPGHQDRFFELELLWDWSRYSKLPVRLIGMCSIIDKYMEHLTKPSLQRAKCLLFKGVTLLLQLLRERNHDVNPDDITRPINECKNIMDSVFHNENRNWRYSEFLTRGYGNGLLSSKDFIWNDSLHRAVNDSESLNSGYEESHHAHFLEFKGQVYSKTHDGHQGIVTCEGVRLLFTPYNAPSSWKVNSEMVTFYIRVSSQHGLQALPVQPYKKQFHHWSLSQEYQVGRIVHIDKTKRHVYFAPPDPSQPYAAKAYCCIDDLPFPPEDGDHYEFHITKEKGNTGSSSRFRARDLHPKLKSK